MNPSPNPREVESAKEEPMNTSLSGMTDTINYKPDECPFGCGEPLIPAPAPANSLWACNSRVSYDDGQLRQSVTCKDKVIAQQAGEIARLEAQRKFSEKYRKQFNEWANEKLGTACNDSHWGDLLVVISAKVARLEGELAMWKPMTTEEATAAIDAIEAEPMDDAEIERIVALVTDPAYQPSEPEHVLMAAKIRQLQSQLSAAQAERDELAACLRRCAVNSSEATGDESKDLPQLEAAVTVPLNEIDDLVNDRFVDMECRLTQAQAATAGLVGDFTEAVSLLSVMAIEGAQFLRRLSCYERVENTEKFYQAICESEKFTAKAIALVESAALAREGTNG